jgi:membrane protease YdiL (CAAX protease family)
LSFSPASIASLLADANLSPIVSTALNLIVVLVIALCVAFWIWWIPKQSNLKKASLEFTHEQASAIRDDQWWLLKNPDPLSAPPGILVITIILIYFFSQIVSGAVLVLLFGEIDRTDPNNIRIIDMLRITIASCGAQLLFIGIFFALKSVKLPPTTDEKDLPWIRTAPRVRDWLIGLVSWVAIVPIVIAMMNFLSKYDKDEHLLIKTMHRIAKAPISSEEILLIGAIGLSVCVLAPITEEILFRGVLTGWFRRGTLKLEFWPAIMVSSALFGLAHYGYGYEPIPLFILALGLGYIHEKTGRLWPCIVVHGLLNLLTFVALIAQLKS